MISVILMEPRNSGNVGAVARVMKNFGFSKLVLVNSKCNPLSETARKRAKHAQEVLKKARKRKKLPKLDYLIGTTAVTGTDYNIPRNPVNPVQLCDLLFQRKNILKKNIGILFGREGI